MDDQTQPNSPMSGEAASAYDPAMIADLQDLFGRLRLAELLSGLRREIEDRLDLPAAERDRLGKDAHALVSVTGTLGFTSLSQACVALECACLAAQDVSAPLQRVQEAAAAARRTIDELHARLA